VGDYTTFLTHWTSPHGGIQGYLSRFLASGDATFQHIAIWTLLQLIESEDSRLLQKIKDSPEIIRMVQRIEERGVDVSSEDENAYSDEEGNGEQEVVVLARRSLELLGIEESSSVSGTSGGGRTLVDG
jgi:vacuolar protein 8